MVFVNCNQPAYEKDLYDQLLPLDTILSTSDLQFELF